MKRQKDYVCPNCFERVNKCRCKNESYYLIMIDFPLQEIIKTLNNKGYKTVSCCAGHKEKAKSCLFIMFAKPIESFPEGFTMDKNNCIRYWFKDKSDYKAEQEKALQSLKKWCENLKDREV